jgi:two-component system, NarL family, sensor histidine kinase UhpB
MEALSAHICVLNEHGVILKVNEAWRRFGRENPPVPADSFVGENYIAVCDRATGPESAEAEPFAAGLRAILSGEIQEFSLEYPCHAPGEMRWFLAKVTRFYERKSLRVVVAHENITDRKQAEDALRKSEECYRAVVEDQTEVIVRFTAEGTITFVNEVYCRFFRKTGRELMGRRWQLQVVPADLPVIEAHLERLSPQNPVVTVESRVYSGSGKVRWMQFVNRGFFDPAGRLLQIQAVGRDVTDRRETEEALRSSEMRFSRVFHSSPVPIAITRLRDNHLIDVNEAWSRTTGYPREEVIERTSRELGNWAQPGERSSFVRELKTKGVVRNFHLQLRHRSGSIAEMLMSAVEVDLAGESYMVSIAQDVTELRKAEARIREFSRKLLHVREQEKRALSAALHHEVGSFAVSITSRMAGLEDALRAGNLKDGRASLRKCRRMFAESVKRLKTVAVDLMPPDLDLLGLSAALRELLTRIIRETSLQIRFTDSTAGEPIRTEVAALLFRSAQECLNNIIQHASAHHVKVRLHLMRQRVVLTIEDDGKGFDFPRIALEPGSRLGLRAMQEMIADVGGTVKISSAPGRGTRIDVTCAREQQNSKRTK